MSSEPRSTCENCRLKIGSGEFVGSFHDDAAHFDYQRRLEAGQVETTCSCKVPRPHVPKPPQLHQGRVDSFVRDSAHWDYRRLHGLD
jgi:hypothetical protein